LKGANNSQEKISFLAILMFSVLFAYPAYNPRPNLWLLLKSSRGREETPTLQDLLSQIFP